MKFRKKPVVVEAIQAKEGYRNIKELIAFAGEENVCPIPRCINYILKIRTLEGEMAVRPGDWIIRGVKGEVYPCKPDIFELTYETVNE